VGDGGEHHLAPALAARASTIATSVGLGLAVTVGDGEQGAPWPPGVGGA